MVSVPMPSQTASPVTSVAVSADSAMASPISAPKSSSRTTGSSGFLDRRMNCHQLASPRTLLDSTMAVRNEKVSSTIANSRMPIATPGDSTSWGCRIFSSPRRWRRPRRG